MNDLNLTRLRYFTTIAELGNMHRASEALHIAQPALSRHVQTLEDGLGVALLTRNARGVVPTEAGQLLMRGADMLMQMAGQLQADIRSKASIPRGVVRIGTLPSTAQIVLPHVITSARLAFPEMTFSTSQGYTSQLQEMLLSDRLDLAVFTDPGDHPDLATEPLYQEDMWAVGRQGSLPGKAKTLNISDLAGLPLIVSRFLRSQLERHLSAGELQVVVELESTVPFHTLLAEGVGIYFGPASLFWDGICSGELEGRPIRRMRSLRVLARRRMRPQTAANLAISAQLHASVLLLAKRKNSPIKLLGLRGREPV